MKIPEIWTEMHWECPDVTQPSDLHQTATNLQHRPGPCCPSAKPLTCHGVLVQKPPAWRGHCWWAHMCQQVTIWADLTTEAKRRLQHFVTLTWPTSTPQFYALHSECKVSYQGTWCPSFCKLRSCQDSGHRGFSSASNSDKARFFSFRVIHFNVIPEQQENTSHCPAKSLSKYWSLLSSPKKSYIKLPILHSRMIQ